MRDAIEILRYIGLKHPVLALLHDPDVNRVEGSMGRPSGPEAV